MESILRTATKKRTLKTFVEGVYKSDLNQILEEKGPFTVFVPNDNAFAKLPQATISELLKDKERLRDLISYHICPGKLTLIELTKTRSLATLGGAHIALRPENDLLWINQTKIIEQDILCQNGIIHILYQVLYPYGEHF